jgi:gliding motility-associated protein GldL
MGLTDFTHSRRWKVFMNYVYSIGASIVLLGALFKLQHWPGGPIMLTIGMSTEALIFFLSAFEPSSEMPDWTKVYPQLKEDFAHLDADELFEESMNRKPKSTFDMDTFLESTEISPELLNKLQKGLTDLSNTARSFADISSATMATDVYVKNLNAASESMNIFAEVNSRAGESVDKTVNKVVISGEKLAESYHEFVNTIQRDFKVLNDHSGNYTEGLESINNNLASLNASYEAQLEGARKQAEIAGSVHKDFAQMNELLSSSVQEAKRYQAQTEELNKNLEALNSVYGNMLGAMNIKK